MPTVHRQPALTPAEAEQLRVEQAARQSDARRFSVPAPAVSGTTERPSK